MMTTLTKGKVMNEPVKVAIATEDEAVAWIGKALDEGDFAKEAESYQLVRRFELDLETISAAWDEKRREAKARLALDRARLTDLSARLAMVKPKIEALKEERLERPAASKRRPLPPDPSEEIAKSKADLFISPSIQPEIGGPRKLQPNDQRAEPIKDEPKRKEDEPEPKSKPGVIIDMGAPYEVARRFLVDRYRIDGVATLRWWNAEWRKWTGTYYAAMEEDALRAEIYHFLAKANYGKFDPASKHVNAVVDAIKAWVLLSADAEVGAWLGDGLAPWGDEPIICCKNGVLRLSDGRLWPHDPRLFTLNVIETEYRPEVKAPRWEQFLEELWGEDHATCNALQEFFGLVLTDETKF
jgi:hypothetical protein